MNRFVVMVDAGYLLRQAVELISHRASHSRGDLDIPDPAALIQVLLDKSRATLSLADKELLRVYWYDGVMANGFTAQQRSIMQVDDVQFRAGTVNLAGQQKGVDSLIVTDLIELATHHAVCDAVLVTGDSDLAVGIELAQRRGIRVAVLGVEDLAAGVAHHQGFELTSRADRVGRLGSAELAPVLRYLPYVPQNGATLASGSAGTATAPAPYFPAPSVVSAVDQEQITAAVKAFVAAQPEPPTGFIDASTNRIDSAIDRALLHLVFTTLARGKLSEPEKIFARQVFRTEI